MQAILASAAIAIAAAAMPASHASDSAQQAATTDVIQAEPDRAERMTVPVRIGDKGAFRFLLDTGSQNTVIARPLAMELGLPAGQRATVVGVAGRLAVDTVEVDAITLGRRSYFGLLAPLLEREDIGADGILGVDGLQRQRVVLDFQRNLIAVDSARGPGGDLGYEIVVSARRKSGQLIMTDARIDGIRTAVVIDTGSAWTIGNRALQRALSRRNVIQQQVQLGSVTGQTLVADLMLASRLVVDHLTLNNVAIVYADAPPFEVLGLDRRPAILLGMRELRGFNRVAIDFQSRRILFDLPRD